MDNLGKFVRLPQGTWLRADLVTYINSVDSEDGGNAVEVGYRDGKFTFECGDDWEKECDRFAFALGFMTVETAAHLGVSPFLPGSLDDGPGMHTNPT